MPIKARASGRMPALTRIGSSWAIASRIARADTSISGTKIRLAWNRSPTSSMAAVIASIAGSFYVEFTSFVGPDLYDINIILSLFFMLFVGGRGSTIGPVVGAGVVVIVPQLMSGLERYQNLIFFVILLLLLLIRPAGLFGRVRESVPLSAILPGWLRASRRAGAA